MDQKQLIACVYLGDVNEQDTTNCTCINYYGTSMDNKQLIARVLQRDFNGQDTTNCTCIKYYGT